MPKPRSIFTLWHLWQLKRLLEQLPAQAGISAHKDPTMLFSGLMWGIQHKHLLTAFWPLKTALFYYGDRLVETVINQHGLATFQQHFIAHESSQKFYEFCPELITDTRCKSDLQHLLVGYQQCEKTLFQSVPQYAQVVLQDWIVATNLALHSTFFVKDWQQAFIAQDAKKLEAVLMAEQQAKNVDVVLQILKAAQYFPYPLPYSGQEEKIVKASSHWFTLMDDWLDLEADIRDQQPNYVVLFLIQQDEYSQWKYADAAQRKQLASLCPKTTKAWQHACSQARLTFKQTFPVLPQLFIYQIEKRMQKQGISPF